MTSHAPEILNFLDDHWCNVMWERNKSHPLGSTPEASLQKLTELREQFIDDLLNMPPDQVKVLVMETLHEQDRARPFHAFGTEADFEHYGRCAFLTAREAVPLSLGKDPLVVTFELVRPYIGASLFANEYAKRLDLIDRAILWGELRPLFTPLEFLTWAHRYKVSFPNAFADFTFERGEPIWYWHDAYEATSAKLAAVAAELDAVRVTNAELIAKKDERDQQTFDDWIEAQDEIARLRTESEATIAALQGEVAELRKQNADLQADTREAAFSTTERNSLLTIVLAAAIDAYRYDPKSDRNPATKEIADAATLLGLKMTGETVLKYLKLALKLKGLNKSNIPRRETKSAKPKPKSA